MSNFKQRSRILTVEERLENSHNVNLHNHISQNFKDFGKTNENMKIRGNVRTKNQFRNNGSTFRDNSKMRSPNSLKTENNVSYPIKHYQNQYSKSKSRLSPRNSEMKYVSPRKNIETPFSSIKTRTSPRKYNFTTRKSPKTPRKTSPSKLYGKSRVVNNSSNSISGMNLSPRYNKSFTTRKSPKTPKTSVSPRISPRINSGISPRISPRNPNSVGKSYENSQNSNFQTIRRNNNNTNLTNDLRGKPYSQIYKSTY